MGLTILHVEDDESLAEVVRLAFEGFGFRGTVLTAETVAEAQQVLDDVEHRGGVLDLIISDMALPDGTGLEVVRRARGNPAWAVTPILMLSGDADPQKVGRAYALGVNSYVSKWPRGRSLMEVIRALFDHWLKDVVLPGPQPSDRTRSFLSRAIQLRSRHGAFYMRIAERFGDQPSEVSFWLSRAVGEANLSNLLAFLERQVAGRHLPVELLDQVEQAQANAERELARIERMLDELPIISRDMAYRWSIELVRAFELQLLAQAISHLFPVAPVAMEAIRDLIAASLESLAGWVEIHAAASSVRGESTSLRGVAAGLRALPAEAPQG